MRNSLLWLGSILLLVATMACAGQEQPEEILITGRLPGPPLWRVSNGEHVLWIFANFSPIPKGMQWESAQVEQVLSEAEEYLPVPMQGISIGLSGALVVLNPINMVRGVRLFKRLSHNPDGKPLKDTLPPDFYQRFSALKLRYFPKDKDIEELRPLYAMQNMSGTIQQQAGLVKSKEILDQINQLAGKNRKLKRTYTGATLPLEGSYSEMATRLETLHASLPVAKEQACFDQTLRTMELDLEAMKARANAWAQGHIDEFRNIVLREAEENPCDAILSGSSEAATLVELKQQGQKKWLYAAERALVTNHSTFAVLGINDLLKEDGLLSKLRENGYSIREPQ